MTKRTCRDCGSTHEYIPTNRTRGRKTTTILHVDETGRSWQGLVCARCHYGRGMQRERDKGRLPWDINHPTDTIRKGVEGEMLVESILLSQGKIVVRVGGRNNPDILWDIGLPEPVKIEVKVVSRHAHGSLYVSKICENRKNDDYVAVVELETKQVRYFSMGEHLALCGNTGKRNVTNLFAAGV